jgi:hypothetical protein
MVKSKRRRKINAVSNKYGYNRSKIKENDGSIIYVLICSRS